MRSHDKKKSTKQKTKKRIKNNQFNNGKKLNLKWLFILSYLLYLFFIVMLRMPYLAEQFTNNTIPDNIESHLIFYDDGNQSHYNIVRFNDTSPGRIDVYYYSKTNTIKTNIFNVKSLAIDCRSMYEDECKQVFGINPSKNSNYYKWFFIEKNHLNVNLKSDSILELIKFIDVPKPNLVVVDGLELTEGKNYFYSAEDGIALSDITSGSHTIDIYFKSEKLKGPVAKISFSKKLIHVNETLKLDGSGSYDINKGGKISNYLWDFGDGNFTTGESLVEHAYTLPGIYGIILTVINLDFNLGHAYLNITVIPANDLFISGKVPDINVSEDSKTYHLELKDYEPSIKNKNNNYYWYITGENLTLYSISGENGTDGIIMISPNSNRFGNDLVWLWLCDNDGNGVYQQLWINITPINDPPTIFGAPDITLHYNVPYEFNYLPYISDVDTSVTKLIMNSSDNKNTNVVGHNITYRYSKSMIGEIIYVIITVWDGQFESSDVVAVWVTDDWVPNLVKPLPNVYLEEGEAHKNYFDLDDYFNDPDNDTLYYSYGYTHVNVVINPNHTVDFFAPEDWNGEEMTTFRATDPSGALVEDIINVIVHGVNDPPIIRNVPNLIVRYGQDYRFDITAYIYDEDNSLKELTLTTSDPDHIRIGEENNLEIILNYPYRQDIPYTKTVTLTISDGLNSSYQIITVYVKDNYPPVLKKHLPEIILKEDQPEKNILNLNEYFHDNDSLMLYYIAINYEHVAVEFDVNGYIDISTSPNWSGEETITIRAIDPESAFIEDKLEVKVLPVNDPPVILEIPKLKFNESEKYKLDIYPFITDVDNNITQLRIWIDECKIDCEIYGTKIIFYTTKLQTTTAILHVSDGQSEVYQKILIEVTGKKAVQNQEYYEIMLLLSGILVIIILGVIGVIIRNYYGSYKVNELFLIYRNGCLILHKNSDDFVRDDSDADIIGAMFTAVQDFTMDSFAHLKNKKISHDENWRLKKMEFKNNNILLDRGKRVYLAVVFTGRLGKKLELDLRKMRIEIETKCKSELEDWEGNMDEMKEIKSIIDQYNIIPDSKFTKDKGVKNCNDTDFKEVSHQD